jgi:hypothetical protein
VVPSCGAGGHSRSLSVRDTMGCGGDANRSRCREAAPQERGDRFGSAHTTVGTWRRSSADSRVRVGVVPSRGAGGHGRSHSVRDTMGCGGDATGSRCIGSAVPRHRPCTGGAAHLRGMTCAGVPGGAPLATPVHRGCMEVPPAGSSEGVAPPLPAGATPGPFGPATAHARIHCCGGAVHQRGTAAAGR